MLISLKNCLLKCKMEMKIGRRKQGREPPHSYMGSDLCCRAPGVEEVDFVLVADDVVQSDALHTFWSFSV